MITSIATAIATKFVCCVKNMTNKIDLFGGNCATVSLLFPAYVYIYTTCLYRIGRVL